MDDKDAAHEDFYRFAGKSYEDKIAAFLRNQDFETGAFFDRDGSLLLLIKSAIDKMMPAANNEVRQMVIVGDLEERFAVLELEHVIWRRVCDMLRLNYKRERS
jgi:hypothetical protein